MTIEHYEGIAEMICDSDCDATFGPVADGDEDVLRTDAKAAGWRTYKDAEGWKNSCPFHVRQFAESQKLIRGLF